jgi:hypothetical protein
VLGALAAAGFALWLLIRYQMGRYLRNYTLKRVCLKLNGMKERVDYYYADILRQLSFWSVRVEEGDTIRTFCRRADRYVRLDFYKWRKRGYRHRHRYACRPIMELIAECILPRGVETNLREVLGGFCYFLHASSARQSVELDFSDISAK